MERRFALIKHTHFLSDLADFSVSSPADGDVLEYDSSTSKWVNVTVASLGGLAEAVQDLAGAALTDTTSVNFTYTDGTGLITADVLPAGVDHNSLLNYVADQHVAHSGVTMTAGAGLTGGGDISATRTFAVGAGTGITVNADDVALSAGSIASLLLADSALQSGDSNALLTNGAGYITSSSLPTGANPAASVGLTAVNGSASTFLRSDGAPALDQGIAPTWTGAHTFTKLVSIGAPAAGPSLNVEVRNDTSAGVFFHGPTVGIRFDGAGTEAAIEAVDDTGFASFEPLKIGGSSIILSVSGTTALQVVAGPQAQFPNGSAGTPSIAFVSDTNTGLYSIAADQLGFSEGGTGYRIGYRDIPRRTSGFARGEALAISAGVTLNTSDMAAGYAFTVYNDSASAITITQGSGVTLRLAGGATTGNRTLAARGIATIWCNSGTEAVISGAGVT